MHPSPRQWESCRSGSWAVDRPALAGALAPRGHGMAGDDPMDRRPRGRRGRRRADSWRRGIGTNPCHRYRVMTRIPLKKPAIAPSKVASARPLDRGPSDTFLAEVARSLPRPNHGLLHQTHLHAKQRLCHPPLGEDLDDQAGTQKSIPKAEPRPAIGGTCPEGRPRPIQCLTSPPPITPARGSGSIKSLAML
jgi:hypothetical protein